MASTQNRGALANDLESRRWDQMLRGDTKTLSGMLSDDLIYVHSSGGKDGKQAYIKSISSGAAINHSVDRIIEAVVPLGDHAFIASGVVRMEAALSGTLKHLHSILTVIWRSEQNTWRLVAHQTTLLPADDTYSLG